MSRVNLLKKNGFPEHNLSNIKTSMAPANQDALDPEVAWNITVHVQFLPGSVRDVWFNQRGRSPNYVYPVAFPGYGVIGSICALNVYWNWFSTKKPSGKSLRYIVRDRNSSFNALKLVSREKKQTLKVRLKKFIFRNY